MMFINLCTERQKHVLEEAISKAYLEHRKKINIVLEIDVREKE